MKNYFNILILSLLSFAAINVQGAAEKPDYSKLKREAKDRINQAQKMIEHAADVERRYNEIDEEIKALNQDATEDTPLIRSSNRIKALKKKKVDMQAELDEARANRAFAENFIAEMQAALVHLP